ncbi:MAG: hypothetical protein K2X04_07235 [Burkholderiales bacterium]|nr:hypothetical protein [Burkholderiales bacterium]
MKNYNSSETFIKDVVIPYLSGDENKPISSVCYDLNGNIIFASNVFAKSFGYQSNKVTARPLS